MTTEAKTHADWVANNRERLNAYRRERYRRLHPVGPRPPLTLAQEIALADLRALGGMTRAERSVQPWELEGEQRIGGNRTSIQPATYGEITVKADKRD